MRKRIALALVLSFLTGATLGDGPMIRKHIVHHLPHLTWRKTTITTTGYVVNRNEIGKCDVYTRRTASGTIPRVGTAAVDTRVFPFGTIFRIPGYGIAKARDRGGAVIDHVVDLVQPTCRAAFNWGRRSQTVYFATPFPQRHHGKTY